MDPKSALDYAAKHEAKILAAQQRAPVVLDANPDAVIRTLQAAEKQPG